MPHTFPVATLILKLFRARFDKEELVSTTSCNEYSEKERRWRARIDSSDIQSELGRELL